MCENQIPVPDFLPTPLKTPPSNLEDLALGLHQRLADYASRVQVCERKAQEQIESHTRNANRVIAQLASQRFEFERLMRRILPELEKSGMEEVGNVLNLYARNWDTNLNRAQVEVLNLNGMVLTDELIELVEVESAIPDAAVTEARVRETVLPLVKVEGRPVALAKVITSVPVPPDEKPKMEEETP